MIMQSITGPQFRNSKIFNLDSDRRKKNINYGSVEFEGFLVISKRSLALGLPDTETGMLCVLEGSRYDREHTRFSVEHTTVSAKMYVVAEGKRKRERGREG